MKTTDTLNRLIDKDGDPVYCEKCGSENTFGEFETDIDYDEDGPHEMTVGFCVCGDCGITYKL